ncbi:MAG TPA: DUF4386 domain-containing protein [Nocardioidaceae bacterium]|nr:DUF4386 domain-containing protein [Nocardioidaceae bacterium]
MSGLIADASPHQAHQAAIPQRRAALIAGVAYVIITVLSLFAISVLDGPIEPDDPAATVDNIENSEALFRSGLAAFIIVLIADVVVAWALYVFFQQASRELSLLAAWFRLLYVAITATALLNLLVVLKLVDGNGYSTTLETGQRDAQVMLSLDAYNYGFFLGLVSFGVHLLLLGYVMVKSNYAPSILGTLVALAGLTYVAINLARVVLPNYRDHEDLLLPLLVVLAAPGEFGLLGWLLWKGGKARPAAASNP